MASLNYGFGIKKTRSETSQEPEIELEKLQHQLLAPSLACCYRWAWAESFWASVSFSVKSHLRGLLGGFDA